LRLEQVAAAGNDDDAVNDVEIMSQSLNYYTENEYTSTDHDSCLRCR